MEKESCFDLLRFTSLSVVGGALSGIRGSVMEVAADSQSDLPELRSWVGEGGGEASGEPSGTDGGEGDRQQ